MNHDQPRNITLKDVANHAGVSKSTVSLVLRNDGAVNEHTRQAVLNSIEATGYIYNRRAASLRENKNKDSFAVILHSLRSPFSSELLYEFEQLSLAQQLLPIFSSNLDLLAQQEKQVQLYLEHGVAGLILCPASGTTNEWLDSLAIRGLPVVQIMRETANASTASVTADNTAGVRAATAHLIQQGHQHIAFIGGTTGDSDFTARHKGYCEALMDAGLPINPHYCQPCSQSLPNGYQAGLALLTQQPDITAVICFTDQIGYGVAQACRELTLTVGQDIALFGFDDLDFSEISNPPLSSIRVDNAAMTEQAIQLLTQAIDGQDIAHHKVAIPTELVLRESTEGLASAQSSLHFSNARPRAAQLS